MKIVKKLTLDFYRSHLQTVYAKEGDTSRWIEATLRDDGQGYHIPENAKIYLTSGEYMTECSRLAEDIVLVHMGAEFTRPGKHPAEITLYADGEKLSTFPFMLDVARDAKDDDAIKNWQPSVIDRIVNFMNAGGTDVNRIKDIIGDYMSEHPAETDKSLTLSNYAADAKVSGDLIREYMKELEEVRRAAYNLADAYSKLARVAKTGRYEDLSGSPTGMKNPGRLIFKNNESAIYDGSRDVSVSIPREITSYNQLDDHPRLNGCELKGDVSLADIGIYEEAVGSYITAWLDGHTEDILPDKAVTPDKCSFFSTTEDNKNYLSAENGLRFISPDGTEWELEVSNEGMISVTKADGASDNAHYVLIAGDNARY